MALYHAGENLSSFEVDAGPKEIAKTDCPNTTLNSMMPRDFGVAAVSGYWRRLNEFCVDGRMIPTSTTFHLVFLFKNGKLNFRQSVVRGHLIGERA